MYNGCLGVSHDGQVICKIRDRCLRHNYNYNAQAVFYIPERAKETEGKNCVKFVEDKEAIYKQNLKRYGRIRI